MQSILKCKIQWQTSKGANNFLNLQPIPMLNDQVQIPTCEQLQRFAKFHLQKKCIIKKYYYQILNITQPTRDKWTPRKQGHDNSNGEKDFEIIWDLHYKSTFVCLIMGIAFNSVLIHKNSPATHITAIQMELINHHEKYSGSALL